MSCGPSGRSSGPSTRRVFLSGRRSTGLKGGGDVKRNVLRFVAGALIVALGASAAPAAVTKKDRRRARLAAHYLIQNQNADGSLPGFSPVGSTADAVLSFVAARRGPAAIAKAIAFLESQADEVQGVGQKAKVVLALHAAGASEAWKQQLLEEIRAAQQPTGQYGDGSDFTGVFSHALAMLALATEGAPLDEAGSRWLADAQCSGGGWQYDLPAGPADNGRCWDGTETDFAKSDTNTTSYAVQALAFAPEGVEPEVNPFKFFRQIRDRAKGGWGYTWGFRMTDANSTALVIQAYRARGRNLPRGSKGALRSLQYGPCSKHGPAFAYTWERKPSGKLKRTAPDAGATIGAILGLLERPLPIRYFQVTRPAPKPRCG